MSEIKCEVVRDLMPLMADEVASEASKELVNDHMEGCEVCRAYYAGMTTQLARMAVPEDKAAFVAFSHRMEKRVRMKKVLTALVAALVALCAVIVSVGVVVDKMQTNVYMPIEKTKAWLWRESGGEVNLAIEMQDGHGWYNNLGMMREGDICYLMPYEPALKLWNKGVICGLYNEFQLDLLWEDGQLYYNFWYDDSCYDPETGFFEHVEREYKIPMRLVRWGQPDNYVTIYEQGDVIPTSKELLDMIEGGEPSSDAVPSATQAVTPTPASSVEED